jgi:C-terminal processing protease CtpA/Prc
LHDHGRAVLLGERTFGKGVVQYYFPLADGSGLKLTVAKYLTPKQYDIVRNGGLAPDTLCRDYPHGVFTKGTADRCVLGALSYLATAPPGLDLSAIDPLYASR